jgi:formate dehydrogenase iron-sulfur subunit
MSLVRTGGNLDPFIKALLEDQGALTAVDRFAQRNESKPETGAGRAYRDLVPLSQPSGAEQYAFEVDLDRCTGCKACVTACHSLNGLDDGEAWRNAGVLIGRDSSDPFQQTVTTACHHCADPACANGCPTRAYEKDPVTGIVRHLDDQCFGCQYCILKCPYDVPKYHSSKGIVRKCDMCQQRLAVGEAPACVQACPTEAIRITAVEPPNFNTDIPGQAMDEEAFLPGTFNPSYTRPTTIYKTKNRELRGSLSGDYFSIEPAADHPPLVYMLLLTQLSVGGFLMDAWLNLRGIPCDWIAPVSLGAGMIGLFVSVLHLGRPALAWKAFLGLRTSWLSREIVVFGLFAGTAVAYTAARGLLDFNVARGPLEAASCMVALMGLLGVYASVMVYHDTQREFWNRTFTGIKFFGSTLFLGSALALLVLTLSLRASSNLEGIRVACVILLLGSIGKGAVELRFLQRPALPRPGKQPELWNPLARSTDLMKGVLAPLVQLRFLIAFTGGILLPVMILLEQGLPHPLASLLILVFCFIAEALERHLFFRAVTPPKMPGGIAK